MDNAFYKELIAASPIGFAYHKIIYDDHGIPTDMQYLEMNPAFELLTGMKAAEVVGRTRIALFEESKEYRRFWLEVYGLVATGGGSRTIDLYSEAYRTYVKVFLYSPDPDHVAALITDVSRAQKDLEEKQIILGLLHDIIFELDEEMVFINVLTTNDRALFMPRDQILGKNIRVLFPPEVADEIVMAMTKARETNQSQSLEYPSILPGDDRWYRADYYYETRFLQKKFIVSVSDITAQRKLQQELIHLSFYDQLTGLYNRRFYDEELKRMDVPRNLPLSLVMADVNHLKQTNDEQGHRMGDELLRTFAATLKRECREDDIVARIGGDEFVILLPRTSSEEVEQIVTRIGTALEQVKIGGFTLSASFGWKTKEQPEESMETVFNQAEDRMYEMKQETHVC